MHSSHKIASNDFKKLVQSRFGSSKGYLSAAAEKLDANYQYLSRMVNGQAVPSRKYIEAVSALPQILQADLGCFKAPDTLTDRIKKVAFYFGRPYEDALLTIIEAGVKIAERQVKEAEIEKVKQRYLATADPAHIQDDPFI